MGTVIVLAVLAAVVFAIVRNMIKGKKGCGGCSSGCASCPSAGMCHGHRKPVS